jgi:predicted CXXCH cytochrome family protein
MDLLRLINYKTKSSLIALSTVITCLISLVACNQAHKEPSRTAHTTNDLLKEGVYAYPHPSQWNAKHVEFYAKFGNKIQGSSQDCQRCHVKNDLIGSPKNISCALQCHSPISKAIGNAPTDSPAVIDDGKACLKCHESTTKQHKPHYPSASGLCSTCHQVDTKHFTEMTKATVTTSKSNQTCYLCHFNKDSQPVVHKALSRSDTSCIDCHNPHGSEQRFFVKQKVENLCLSCHDSVATKDHKSVHGIIKSANSEKSCTNCHFPHSGPNEKLLVAKPDNNLCYQCHDKDIQTKFSSGVLRTIPNIKHKVLEGPHPHPGAAIMGDSTCYTCHATHASQYHTLLNFNYPELPYEKYSPATDTKPDSYQTCFLCHDPGMLNKVVPASDSEDFRTNFRNDVKSTDGKVQSTNLHWFHVVDATGAMDKSQGRSCAVCHDPHGSEQAHSIKTSWKMKNGKEVKIEYTATPTGGQCAKTCHDVRAYKRED